MAGVKLRQTWRADMVRAMTAIYLILFLASAACFALAAFAPKTGGNRLNFVPLGLLALVLVFLIQTVSAL